MGTVTNILIQNNRNCNQQPEPKPIILDQDVGYCSHYFGSGFWLLFPLFSIRLLIIIPIILDQAVG
jgi:hypothetical protein